MCPSSGHVSRFTDRIGPASENLAIFCDPQPPPILSFFLCEAPRSPLVPGEGAAALHTAPRRLRPGGLSAAGTALGEKVWEPRLLGHGGPGRVLSLSLCPHLSWTQLGLGSEGYGEQEGELT